MYVLSECFMCPYYNFHDTKKYHGTNCAPKNTICAHGKPALPTTPRQTSTHAVPITVFRLESKEITSTKAL